jgi:hypothetical protein
MPSFGRNEPHLAEVFPADSQLFLEVPQLGTSMVSAAAWLVDLLPVGVGDEDAVELFVSGLDDLLGWVGDGAMGGGLEDGRLWYGAVVEGASDGAADPYLGLVKLATAAAALAPAMDPSDPDPGFRLSVTETDGVEVMTLSFDAFDMGGPIFVEPSISLARDGDHFLIGTPDWVAQVLDPDRTGSLANDAAYQDALNVAGKPDLGHLYVDITAIREAIEPVLALATPEYDEIAPWVGSGMTGDGVVSTTVLLVLR